MFNGHAEVNWSLDCDLRLINGRVATPLVIESVRMRGDPVQACVE